MHYLIAFFLFIRSTNSLTSIVTGASGFVGRAVVHELLLRNVQCDDNTTDEIVCLVRPQRVTSEQTYWKQHQKQLVPNSSERCIIRVLPYEMLDNGESLEAAIRSTESLDKMRAPRRVFHIASVFGPTENHTRTALDNVQGTEQLVRTLGRIGQCKLILTSSMAAVRATGQEPANGQYYTENDWNTQSKLGEKWGSSYQWSKAESERRAWELCKEFDIPMVSLCPSFVFGPTVPGSGPSSSFSWSLVKQWIQGESPVQSRLCVDVRDLATVQVEAALRNEAVGQRFIVSTEARTPSLQIANWLKAACTRTSFADSAKIQHDETFSGGSIPIGAKEVDALMQLKDKLGVSLRPVEDTIADMALVMLESNPDSRSF